MGVREGQDGLAGWSGGVPPDRHHQEGHGQGEHIGAAEQDRSERAGNLGGTKVLQPDWDLSLSAAWQDEAKRRLFEVFTTGQLRKDLSPTYGVRGIWRF